MIVFQEERWSEALMDEADELLKRHWEEVALNQDTVRLDPDRATYAAVAAAGLIVVTTARDDGRLVGYAAHILSRNLHYQSLFQAENDVYWLAPEHRRGSAGLRLLAAAEEHCRQRGATMIVSRVKLHRDVGAVLERLGYRPIERVYAKRVG